MIKIITLISVAATTTRATTCGEVKHVYTSNSCCGAEPATLIESPCNYESPLEQLRALPANAGQCIDYGLTWQHQNNDRILYSYFFPYHLTEEDFRYTCSGTGDKAKILIQRTGKNGIEPEDFRASTFDPSLANTILSDEADKVMDPTTPLNYVLQGMTTVLKYNGLVEGNVTLNDIGVKKTDNAGMSFTKWYGYFWYKFGYSAIDHQYTASGARVGKINNTIDPSDSTVYDGVVDAKGRCLHFRAPTHFGSFNSPAAIQDNVYLNYKYYTKLVDGRMKIMRSYHLKYTEENVIVIKDLPMGPVPLY